MVKVLLFILSLHRDCSYNCGARRMQNRTRSSYAEPQPAVYSHLNCEYKVTKKMGCFQKNSPNKEQKTTLRLQQLNSQRITSLHAHGDCPRVQGSIDSALHLICASSFGIMPFVRFSCELRVLTRPSYWGSPCACGTNSQ